MIKTVKAENPPIDGALMSIRYMVYGIDRNKHGIIPYGFYRSEERAREKVREFEKRSITNGVACKFNIMQVEFDV